MSQKDTLKRLHRALDMLVEDVMQQSDEEILSEARESEGIDELHARAARAIAAAREAHGQRKLATARTQLAQKRAASTALLGVDVSRARQIFTRLVAQDRGLALAARNGSELSDEQIAQILNDWLALGAISTTDIDS
jgi:hypothetical protein